MDLTGCSTRTRPFQKIQNMFSAQLPTASRFYTCLRSISVSIPYFRSVMGHIPLQRFGVTPSKKCTIFAKFVAFAKSGATCGHAGIHQKCGDFGLDQLHRTFRGFEQPWALRIFGDSSSTITFTITRAPVSISLYGYLFIESLQLTSHEWTAFKMAIGWAVQSHSLPTSDDSKQPGSK